jgi:hypothetical protein
MSIARLIYYSPRIESYADIIAAIVQQYHPDRIEIAFPDARMASSVPYRGREQSEFIENLHRTLSIMGKDHSCYGAAETIEIIPMSCNEDNKPSILQGADVVDVTTIPKKLSVELVAAALKCGRPRVCALTWLSKIKSGERLIIGKDRYDYIDLTRLEETAQLRRSYAARATLILSIGSVFFGVCVIAALSQWVPQLSPVNMALVPLSVAAGIAGLLVAVRVNR